MTPKIRVLAVDDSVVIRRMVTDALNSDPALEVVATAPNGRIALAKLSQVQPDVVILDVEMPEMGGLETLVEIRKTHRRLPVIMFSTLTARGALSTIEALALGATDYVTKPANVGSVTEALQRLRDQLIPKIKQFCGQSPIPNLDYVRSPASLPPPPPSTGKIPSPAVAHRVDAVVIGVSTGGPDALSKLLPALPADLPVPVLIVQHMPPVFTKLLADRLNATSAICVKEVELGDRIKPAGAWVAPGDFHFTVARRDGGFIAQTNQGPHENSCRPSVDVLFRSAVQIYGANTLAIILTGMGRDGCRGCESVRAAGGQVLAQDEASSVVWGMPGMVARAGLANAVLPLNQIADEIIRRVRTGRNYSPTPSPLP